MDIEQQTKGRAIIMNSSPSQTDILSTPDFWMFLLCYAFMGEEKFRELLESTEKEEAPEGLEERR